MNINYVGEGKVQLLAGGGKIFTDIAARFCNSNKDLDDIVASPYTKSIVKNIIESGHLAATEFDNFIFGIEGYSRVTEVQLVRKRLASYLIKSGRQDKSGKREFDIVLPKSILDHDDVFKVDANDVYLDEDVKYSIADILKKHISDEDLSLYIPLGTIDILNIIEHWYNSGVEAGLPEEDLRYVKPQATEFKAIVMMNAHGLMDWFKIRMCLNAQTEIRDLATKMYRLCKEAAPDLFMNAGASCKVLGYCPENDRQHPSCKGSYYTQNEAKAMLKKFKQRERVLNDSSKDIDVGKLIYKKITPSIETPPKDTFYTTISDNTEAVIDENSDGKAIGFHLKTLKGLPVEDLMNVSIIEEDDKKGDL